MSEPKRAFVCGHPIAHSRSPLIHGFWLGEHGLGGSYERIDRAPRDFPAFVASLAEQGFVGGNVTIPHKEAACELCRRTDETARLIGAVNTVWLEGGDLCGTNTDAYGFAANLDERSPGWDGATTALVLGAGGASRAVIHALQDRGVRNVRIVNRTVARAKELRDRFGGESSFHDWNELPDLLSEADLLVNTTSLGMAGHGDAPVPALDRLPAHALVTDIVYVPLVTPLLAAAAARGLKTIDGLGMLLHQAVPGFERWFGVRPTVGRELRRRVELDMVAA